MSPNAVSGGWDETRKRAYAARRGTTKRPLQDCVGKAYIGPCTEAALFGTTDVPLCAEHWRSVALAAVLIYHDHNAAADAAYREQKIQEAEAETFVYYIRRLRDDQIKIGFSRSPGNRMDSLREGHGELELLATEQGGRRKERQRHEQFAHVRQAGEWFLPDVDLLEHIHTLTLGILVP